MIYPDENQTSEALAEHYNSLDKYYRKLWGEHLHHGYFQKGTETVEQATEALINLVVQAGEIKDSSKVLDVGCGYGATARFLAHGVGAIVTALTISKSQWQYARSHDPESTNPRYILGDFLHHTIPEQFFDVIISIETSEHMVEKEKYFAEVARLLKPGGRFVTCACLAKEDPTSWQVKHLLEPICREGRIPSLGSETEYRTMIEEAGLKDVEFHDLSKNVKKTWSICAMRTSRAFLFDKHVRKMLLDKGFSERIFAKTLFRILTAYNTKAMRYGLFSATKQ
ncbi:MAG: class I SAM-dependent methyltransferase [Simkaniaceae bacterium]|nr:class I SAM-dependent methyltransferase [Candidatus Sacchlamyda saccharinae]